MNKNKSPLIFATLVMFAAAGCMPYSTGSTEVGVRTITWSPIGNKGVENKAYAPGSTYWFVPFITDWHTFDTRLFNLEMSGSISRGDRQAKDDLLFKTIDGNDISQDVIISYRIDRNMAPYILQNVARDMDELKDNIIRTVARSKPRDILGELRTEEYYDASNRSEKAAASKDMLNEIMGPWGVVVEDVRLRDYRFNVAYQQAIEEKKIADQQTEKFKSESKATVEEYLKKLEEAKGTVAEMTAEVDGEYLRAVIGADAYFEQQVRLAEAIEAEGRAKAEGLREMNEALAGSGGEAMVKLTIAEALTGKNIVFLPIGAGGLDVRSTDINQLLELYGLKAIAGKGN